MVHIYVLIDPRDMAYRYIGKTKDIDYRLKQQKELWANPEYRAQQSAAHKRKPCN